MATIDLGKIKQVFRGTYNNATAYVPDDLVVFTDTGITSTYICTTASTGNNPSSGGTAHANWAYLAKGVADPIPSQSGQAGKFLTTNGSALSFGSAGKVLQVVSQSKTNVASQSLGSQTWWSYTDASLRATITPTHANNKILITGTITIGVDSSQWIFMRLEKNGSRLDAGNGDQSSSCTRCFTASHHNSDANMPHPNKILNYLDTAGDTNSRYYNFGIAHSSGSTRTISINKGNYGSNNFFDPRCVATITVMEIEA